MSASEAPAEGTESVIAGSRALLGVIARSLAPIVEQVPLPDYRLLVLLCSRGLLSRVEIVPLLDVTGLGLDEMLRRLAAAHLIDYQDGGVTATSKGRALVDEVTERRRAEVARLLGGMSAAERRTVTEGLALIAAAAGEPRPEELLILGL